MNGTTNPRKQAATCLQCDRPAERDELCFPCAAAEELRLSEDQRIAARDLLGELFCDFEDGTPDYQMADHVWITIYKAGFDITRRVIA